MADHALTLDVLDPQDNPVANGALGIAPATTTETGEGVMVADEVLYELSDPFNVVTLVQGAYYRFREYKPTGRTFYAQIPATASGDYSDLDPAPWIPATGGIFGDATVDAVLTDPSSDSYATLLEFVEDHPGPAGPAGPPGAAGGSDAATASWITGGTLTPQALLARDDALLTEKDRALRTWYVAAMKADTVAADIVVPTSDSIGAGAYAGALSKTFLQTMLSRLRKALVPLTITGGNGYYGFADNPILTGSGFVGSTGTVTLTSAWGLGLKGYILSPAATLTYYFTGTRAKLRYRTDPAYGNFTYTVDGGAPVGPIGTTGAAGTVETSIFSGTTGIHTVTITAVGTVGMIGNFAYDGDETAGLRLTPGAHSGFGAQNFVANQAWTADLALVANPKLVLLPIGSNDFYAGRSVAQATADINTLIGLVRTAYGSTVSIVLVAYYDRPPGAAIVPWSDYVDMYRDIAAADDWITVFDAGPLFGPMTGPTDDRNGLTTALPGDYVHPTPEGHRLLGNALADFLMPPGTAGSQASLTAVPTAADVLAAANHKQVYTNVGNLSGALVWSALAIGAYSITATGNLTQSAAAMPPVTAGKTAHHYVRIVQDATGGRTFTPTGIKLREASIVLQTAAAAVDVLHYFWDGAEWIIENLTNPSPSTLTNAAITAVAGDLQGAYTATGFSGPISLGALSINTYGLFRLTLSGAVSFSASNKPAGLIAGKTGSFRLVLVQPAAGGPAVMTWNANVLTAGGVDPTLSTAANAIDIIDFFWTGTELILTNIVKGCA